MEGASESDASDHSNDSPEERGEPLETWLGWDGEMLYCGIFFGSEGTGSSG